MTYDAKVPREKILAAATEIATQTLKGVMQDPHAPVSQLYFLAMDVGAPNGRLAAACMLTNQGKSADQAMRAVSARAHEARMNGTIGMLGVMVKEDGFLAIMKAVGVSRADVSRLRRGAPRQSDELLVIVISSELHSTVVKGNAMTDPVRWN